MSSQSKEIPELFSQESALRAEGNLIFGEVQLGNDGVRIVNISSKNGKQLSFSVLKPEESLIITSLDDEVFSYVSQRTGKQITHNQPSSFFAVAAGHNLRIVDPTIDRLGLPPTPNKRIESVLAAKVILASLADRAIVQGKAGKVAEVESGDVYVLSTDDDFWSASRDLGVETKPVMTVLKKYQGELMFVSHGWGKPLTVAPEMRSWSKINPNNGQLARALCKMGESISSVSDPREQEQVGRHLLGKLVSKADVISRGKKPKKIDNTDGNILAEIPDSLSGYLEEWRNGVVTSREMRYKEKFENSPVPPSASVLFSLADISLDEKTIETKFLHTSPDRRNVEWPRILAEIEVSNYLEPKETKRILRLSGMLALGENAGAAYFGTCEECKVGSAASNWKSLATEEFDKRISKVGADYLSSLTPDQVKALVASDSRFLHLNPVEIYERMEGKFVEPQPGYQWSDIIHREAAELRKLSIFDKQDLPIYETPWTKQLSETLVAKGFDEAAQITWALAEGHVELEETRELEVLAETIAQGAKNPAEFPVTER